MAISKVCVFAVLINVLCLTGISAYYVTVDAHAEECFYEKVSAGTKLGNIAKP